jgi:hypothetical protein
MSQLYHHVEVLVMFPRQIGGENPSHGGLNTLYHHVEVSIMFPRQIGEENSSFEGRKTTFYLEFLTIFYD